MSQKKESSTLANIEKQSNIIAETTQAPPSTVYELKMRSMTPELFATMGVQLVQINSDKLFWLTSVGQIYAFDDYNTALNAEYQWLLSEPK